MAPPKYLLNLLALPTAAFAEQAVFRYVERACRRLTGVTGRQDRYGNFLATYRHRPGGATPLVFTAHTDHPGFVALETGAGGRLWAAFRGYVESDYFAGAKVRFWHAGAWVPGEVLELIKTTPVNRAGRRTSRPEEVLIRVSRPVSPGAPGIWELPGPTIDGDRVWGPALDDLAGVAALLALLARLSRKKARAEVHCLFTRAEEVGFIGAIGAIKARTVPKKLPVIVIEMSKELPTAPIGDGPIVRVGDRMSIYTPALTAFLERVAQDLTKRRKGFAFQRKLMDGGSCEATAYVAYGRRATGICLPLGNYHNMDTDRTQIAPEYISLRDWQRMLDLFEALVLADPGCEAQANAVRKDLDARFAAQAAHLSTR